VRRAFIGSAALLALCAATAVAYGVGVVPGSDGCVWRSVDERAYVGANEGVLRSLALPPRLRRAHAATWTHAVSSPNSCLPFYENGPPYSAFITTHVFVRSAGEPPLGFHAPALGRQWVRQWAATKELAYRKGPARLGVTIDDDSVLLSVDHRAYS
jgi:hypothetical protein